MKNTIGDQLFKLKTFVNYFQELFPVLPWLFPGFRCWERETQRVVLTCSVVACVAVCVIVIRSQAASRSQEKGSRSSESLGHHCCVTPTPVLQRSSSKTCSRWLLFPLGKAFASSHVPLLTDLIILNSGCVSDQQLVAISHGGSKGQVPE